MVVSVDRAGRVVIPKELRDQLALDPGSSLEIRVEGGALVLTPAKRMGRRVVEVDGWPVIEAAPGTTITDADVQRWRDDGQR